MDEHSAAPRGPAPPPRPRHGPRAPAATAPARALDALLRHPVRSALGALGLVVLALVGFGFAWYEGQIGGSPGGSSTIVEVPSGASVGEVTSRLVSQRVIASSLAFRVYLTFHGTPVVLPGGYYLRRHEDFASVRRTLTGGPDVYEVNVPAGFTVAETAERVGQVPGHDGAAFLALVTSGAVHSQWQPAGSDNLDGLLGTGTYVVVPGESNQTLLEQMVQRFDDEAAEVDLPPQAATLGLSPYQAVTAASIVQKEGVYPQNLAKVARVIYNRLARGMDLQMDSTVLYSEGRDGGPVTSADLARDTPYNTYLNPGLTPTPIAFPSLACLRAALAPAPGDWLYFVVVSKDGTEAFADTLAGQDANEALARSRGLP